MAVSLNAAILQGCIIGPVREEEWQTPFATQRGFAPQRRHKLSDTPLGEEEWQTPFASQRGFAPQRRHKLSDTPLGEG